MYSLTLAELAVPNIHEHGKIFWIIATTESFANSSGVGSNIPLKDVFETALRAMCAIALGDLCSRNQ